MPKMSRILCTLAALTAIAAVAPTASAHDGVRRARKMMRPIARPNVAIQLVSADGMGLQTVMHHGKQFVVAMQGQRFAIQLTNRTADRVEAVVSVDGRDVVSGKRGDFRRQRGYVLEPFGSVTIDGFRRSMDHVAAFRFTNVANSFSGRMGTPQNTGVIGVAVFKERMRQNLPMAGGDMDMRRKAAPRAGAADAAPGATRSRGNTSSRRAPRQEMGTGFGETRTSGARFVSFERRSQMRPDAQMAVFYDSAMGLQRRGIMVQPVARPIELDPQPWPGAVSSGFANPPPPMRRRR